ncbi:MAG TPA: adenylate/guanylate cyclase domain-containing protein [Gammaproteobacteria bacterium]|nr:adenylate/guanylate cyclase domain-containing protein [Gammaproteobacteria bacterium]
MKTPNLSLKSKLVFMLLSVALLCVFVIGYQGLHNGEIAIAARVTEQLTGVREAKKGEVESYFNELRNHLKTLAIDHTTVGAMREFGSAFKRLKKETLHDAQTDALKSYYTSEFLPELQLNVEGTPLLEHYLPGDADARYLQYQYIAGNTNKRGDKNALMMAEDQSYYSGVHQYYHPVFNAIIEAYGYYDLFLIDIESGDIVYSVYKETDYATSLKDGIYKTSNLGDLYRNVRKSQDHGDVQLVDFNFYRPSYNSPAAFVGTTIFDDQNKPVGILAVQIAMDKLNQVLTGGQRWKEQGLGETGEAFLVGHDGTMRSNARPLMQGDDCYRKAIASGDGLSALDEKICRLDTSILLQKVDNASFYSAKSGETGVNTVKSYYGEDVISAYSPVNIEGVDWSIMAEMATSEADAPAKSFQKELIISAVIISCLVTFLAMWIASHFIAPLTNIMHAVKKLSNGEVDTNLDTERHDEYGDLARTLNQTIDLVKSQKAEIVNKTEENRGLLENILPSSIADRVERGESNIADRINSVTILFTSLRGFTDYVEGLAPDEAVKELNEFVNAFDDAAQRHGVERIKTIGDSYMAACGLTVPRLDHAKRTLEFAREILAITRRYNAEHDTNLGLRAGIHCGSVVAGVIGKSKFIYDVWGDTVNIASRIRFEADPNTIMVTSDVHDRLDNQDGFGQCTHVSTKGMGELSIWQWSPDWLLDEAETQIMEQPIQRSQETA